MKAASTDKKRDSTVLQILFVVKAANAVEPSSNRSVNNVRRSSG